MSMITEQADLLEDLARHLGTGLLGVEIEDDKIYVPSGKTDVQKVGAKVRAHLRSREYTAPEPSKSSTVSLTTCTVAAYKKEDERLVLSIEQKEKRAVISIHVVHRSSID